MKVGLVLGGGGLIGLGFHAGALKALADRGIDASGADLIVGTSAGALIAAYLGTGTSPTAFYERALVGPGIEGQRRETRALFAPLWASPADRVRRFLGSGFAMVSSRGLWRFGRPPQRLRRAFPSGLYSTAETRARLAEEIPDAWPERELLICAADLYTGKRVAFGAPGVRLQDAVMASIAIPGVFPPVRIGGRDYVDGGVVSATSLDLAADAGCRAIVCIAPLGFHDDLALPFRHPRSLAPIIVRAPFTRSLKREVAAARAQGIDVLVLRPYLSDVLEWGTNFMRDHDRAEVAERARAGVARMLDDAGDHPALVAAAGNRP